MIISGVALLAWFGVVVCLLFIIFFRVRLWALVRELFWGRNDYD